MALLLESEEEAEKFGGSVDREHLWADVVMEGQPRAERDPGIHCNILSAHSFSAASEKLTEPGRCKKSGTKPIHYYAIKRQMMTAISAEERGILDLLCRVIREPVGPRRKYPPRFNY